MYGSGIMVYGSGCRLRVEGREFVDWGLGARAEGLGFRVQCLE